MQESFQLDTNISDAEMHDVLHIASNIGAGEEMQQFVQSCSEAIAKQETQRLADILQRALDAHGPAYPLVLAYLCHPQACQLYARLGIGEAIRKKTFADISLWSHVYASRHASCTGLTQIYWLARLYCAKVLRLGRLQFEEGKFCFPYRIFKEKITNKQVVMAEQGLICDKAGYLATKEKGAFTTSLINDQNCIVGHVVDIQGGTIAREVQRFVADDLQPIAQGGDKAIHIHVPAMGKLMPEEVQESFAWAYQFYPHHTLYCCESWLLDPALEHISPHDGNICTFMHLFNKFPIADAHIQIFDRVFDFGASEEEVLSWKCTTSLQREAQEYLRLGGVFHTTGGYFLRDGTL